MRTLFLILLLQATVCTAQNLVPNPGFELVTTCNVTSLYDGMQNSVVDWSTYDYSDNSPDIFNDCFATNGLTPGTSVFGFTSCHSGSGIAGIASMPSSNDYREVISSQLTKPLLQDSAYCVSFLVKNSMSGGEAYYSKNIGLRFSDSHITHDELRAANAQIEVSTIVTGNHWTEVSGYYIAAGGEQFIHIGYFGPQLDYFTTPGSSGTIYYYVDDVSVMPCNKDSLISVVLDLPNVFTPNGDPVNSLYEIKTRNINYLQVQIMDRWGGLVANYDGLTTTWNGEDQSGTPVNEGVYFVKVTAETSFGETLAKQQFIHLIRNNN